MGEERPAEDVCFEDCAAAAGEARFGCCCLCRWAMPPFETDAPCGPAADVEAEAEDFFDGETRLLLILALLLLLLPYPGDVVLLLLLLLLLPPNRLRQKGGMVGGAWPD